MKEYETESGYIVKEFNGGIDVYEDDVLVCEIDGYCLDDFTYDDVVDDDELEKFIKEEIETNEFLDNMSDFY